MECSGGYTGAPAGYLAETRPRGMLGACHQGCARISEVFELKLAMMLDDRYGFLTTAWDVSAHPPPHPPPTPLRLSAHRFKFLSCSFILLRHTSTSAAASLSRSLKDTTALDFQKNTETREETGQAVQVRQSTNPPHPTSLPVNTQSDAGPA